MRERLSIAMTLTVGGQEHTIPGGNVRALAVAMTAWGVTGTVDFVMQAGGSQSGPYLDEVLDDFVKPDLGQIRLSVRAAHLDTSTEAADAAFSTGGIVLGGELREEVHQRALGAQAVLSRRYTVRFADPAFALWSQHFPCDLRVGVSFKDVIEAHKGDRITLTYDWDAITATPPHVFVNLDASGQASFYDLVVGYVGGRGGVLSFDHAARTYAITGAKAQDGEPAQLPGDDVASMTWIFTPPSRHTPRVRNSYSEGARTETAENANAATGIFRDGLLRTPVSADVDAAVAAAKGQPLAPSPELSVAFRRFPTVSIAPGSLVNVSAAGGHSAARRLPTEPMRVVRVAVQARALDDGPDKDLSDDATGFDLTIDADLEAKSETIARLPSVASPRYPGYLEGKIVSEVGGDSDRTYQFATNDQTSIETYRVAVPLFKGSEDCVVVAPYEPHAGAGAVYFPLYKNQRVLVALDFDRAHVARLLDWRGEARVPADGQGQQIFFGTSQAKSTSVLHDYQDEKPVLRVLRQNDKDTVVMKLAEGKLTLQVEETKG